MFIHLLYRVCLTNDSAHKVRELFCTHFLVPCLLCTCARWCAAQDQQATVLGRLQHIALHGLWKVTFVGTETLTADSLTTQLSLLSAVRYTASDSHNTTVTLQGWTVTSDIVTALHGLPHMSGTLKFVACAWPSEPAVCAQLAHTGL